MSDEPIEAFLCLPTEEQGRILLRVARRELHFHFGLDSVPEIDCRLDPLSPAGGLFVTLELGGELRGCIGYLRRDVDLVTLAQRAAIAAAVDDPRFPSVSPLEIPRIRICVTVLALPEVIQDRTDFEIGRHGLIVENACARGLLLPQVAARYVWDRARFLAETCRKAGLPLEEWRDPRTIVQRFEAVQFEEEQGTGLPA